MTDTADGKAQQTPALPHLRRNDCLAVGPSGVRCRGRRAGHPGRHYTYLRDDDEGVVIEEWTRWKDVPCARCGHMVGWIECPTGGWWAHHEHPEDGHDAVPVLYLLASDPDMVMPDA